MLDVELKKSKYCEKCKTQEELDKWFEMHLEKKECNINYSGASGGGGGWKKQLL